MSDVETALNNARGTELKVGGFSLYTIRRGDVEYVALIQLAELVRGCGINSYQLYQTLQDTQHSKDVQMTSLEAYYLRSIGRNADYPSLDRALVSVDDLVSYSQMVHMPPSLIEKVKAAVAQNCKQQRPATNS